MTLARDRFPLTDAELEEFCRKWNITEFALFGSIVREDFRDDSDIDVMVTFAPHGEPLGFRFLEIQFELEERTGRNVDVMVSGPIQNPFRSRSILRDLTVLYAA